MAMLTLCLHSQQLCLHRAQIVNDYMDTYVTFTIFSLFISSKIIYQVVSVVVNYADTVSAESLTMVTPCPHNQRLC